MFISVFNMKNQAIKYLIQIFFFFWFIWFSWKSIKSFYLGNVVYEIYKNSANEKIFFPAITLCPNQKMNPLVNLKLDEFGYDKNITESHLQSFRVFSTLNTQESLMDIIKNYSFTEKESFTSGFINGNQLR